MKPIAIKKADQSAYSAVFAHTPFRSLWFGQIFSQFAISTLLFVLALRIYQTTQSNAAVSGLFLAYGIPAVVFGIVAGTMVDRLDKRRVLVLCDVLRGVFVMCLLFFSHHVAIVYVLTFFNALITQLYIPAEVPLIPKLLPKKLLVPANSMFAFTYYCSLALGSIAAGPFFRWFGPEGIFIFIGMLFWLAAWFSFRLPSQSAGTIGFHYILSVNPWYLVKRVWQHLIEGTRYVRSKSSLFEAISLLTVTQIVIAILGTLGPGFADQVMRIDIRDVSLLVVGPVILGIVVGALWVGNNGTRFGTGRLISAGVFAQGIILITLAISVHILRIFTFPWLAGSVAVIAIEMVLLFLLGVANGLLDVPANTMLQQEAEGGMRSRVYGILGAFVGGVGLLPVVLGGVLADRIGVGNVIFLLGCMISIYSVLRLRYNKI
jgi:DHA3 family macrolide efflux protein-like MFS transporter